ncbi:hypothetical protein M595_3637 [Lyngbya aestuarii BL J]|uniref:Uncharacterized protein n=1 Tax=Lyngbya aestuarii BL J TaxID=1348334 RepID=U7QJ44_9CYAN|nr:hypothetical protein [Lyngbya aestuarii]ERT06431.1 hypothetical protein M595_3637 [Lyngbya aestuarii BL J]
MKPEQITASFFQVLNNQPELFTQEIQQDLTQLEIAVDRVEYIPEDDQTEFLADAIIDFCDVNPTIYQALSENLNTSQTEDSEKITVQKRFLLSQKIRSLLTYSSEI